MPGRTERTKRSAIPGSTRPSSTESDRASFAAAIASAAAAAFDTLGMNNKAGPAVRNPICDPKWDGRSTFSIEEAGEILGLSRSAAYEAAKDGGSLPTIQIGRRKIVPRLALERLLNG
jgi:hypothetical protein